MFIGANDWLWSEFEQNALPPASDAQYYYIKSFFNGGKVGLLTPFALGVSALVTIEKTILCAYNFFTRAKEQKSVTFKDVLKDSSKWKELKDIEQSLESHPPAMNNPQFLWGSASCTYQDSGYKHCPDSQWHLWEKKTLPLNNQSKKSLDLYNIYKTNPMFIVEQLKKLGLNSYRTSIEWSHIEPKPGKYDCAALKVYIDFFKCLKENSIEPMVTLHHFSEPKWFHDLGSFEKEQNIRHFVNFAAFVYPELTSDFKKEPLVKWICTINEPSIEAFSRYVRGAYSPGVKFNFSKAGAFIQGAMKAHFTVYKELKELNSSPEIKIGFTHQYLKFQAGNPLVIPATRYLTALINDTVLNVFKNKQFSLKVPLMCNQEVVFDAEDVKSDFIGVQYYTRPIISLTGSITQNSEEKMTQMPFREDPAGLYEAIVDTYHATQTPIIVTENGISTHSDEQRNRYMQRALYSLQQAEQDLPQGAVQGYYQWSLVDNLEWDLGMEPQAFGAFAAEKTRDGYKMADNPKPGMTTYQKVLTAWNRMQEKLAA
jgi:beta-glucosidase